MEVLLGLDHFISLSLDGRVFLRLHGLEYKQHKNQRSRVIRHVYDSQRCTCSHNQIVFYRPISHNPVQCCCGRVGHSIYSLNDTVQSIFDIKSTVIPRLHSSVVFGWLLGGKRAHLYRRIATGLLNHGTENVQHQSSANRHRSGRVEPSVQRQPQ